MMKKVVFFLLVSLLAGSTAFANYIPIIREVENGCPSLRTFVVGLTMDEEGPLELIGNLNIELGAHQLTILGELTTDHDGVIGPALGEYAVLDTYFFDDALAVYGNYTNHHGSEYLETNDGSDPCNIVTEVLQS